MSEIPQSYDPAKAEREWAERWERDGLYRWDPDALARRDLRGRHAAAHGVGLAAHRSRVQLHAGRRDRSLPAHDGEEHLLPDRLGRQRARDRAARAERVRRPTRPAQAVRPELEADARAPEGRARRGSVAAQLHRSVRAGHRRGRARVRGRVAADRALRRLDHPVHDDRRALPAHVAALVPRPGAEGRGVPEVRADGVGRRRSHRGRAGRDRGPRACRARTTTCASASRAAASSRSRPRDRSCSVLASPWSRTPTTRATSRTSASARAHRSSTRSCRSCPHRTPTPRRAPAS